MPVNTSFLPDSSYVVLGLLSFGSRLTGYEIRQWALGSTRFFWSAPAMSQIYRELGRLEASGYVSSRDEAVDDRARTTYGITRRGRTELSRWVNDAPLEEPEFRHPAALRLFLGHMADRMRLVEILEEHHRWVSDLLADLAEVDAGLAGDPAFEYPSLVAQWGHRFYGGERRATAEIVKALSAEPGGDQRTRP
jgi:DNA-binding PadR family transcriptional regulator